VPAPFDEALWIVLCINVKEVTDAVIDPNFSRRQSHVDHQSAHFMSAAPTANALHSI
jgi:hypothetical protein